MLLVAAMQLLLSIADIVVSNMQKAVERVVLNAMLMCRYAFMQRVFWCILGKIAQDVYRHGVKVLWCHSHLVWLVFEGFIPIFL